MNIINLLFPIIKIFEDLDTNELDIIVQNNFELAKELEDKPPMTAQQIKEYVKNKKDEKINL
jgi:hypothetical protein